MDIVEKGNLIILALILFFLLGTGSQFLWAPLNSAIYLNIHKKYRSSGAELWCAPTQITHCLYILYQNIFNLRSPRSLITECEKKIQTNFHNMLMRLKFPLCFHFRGKIYFQHKSVFMCLKNNSWKNYIAPKFIVSVSRNVTAECFCYFEK